MVKKDKKNNKKDKSLPRHYTKVEREKKIFSIRFQLIELDMNHILTEEMKEGMDKFIENGTPYYVEKDLPEFSRVLKINLVNDKKLDTFIKLEFKRIRVEDEGDENIINRINKEHEQEFMKDLYHER